MQGNTTDRLFKIKPILDYFVKKCQLVYKTNQEISLDEGIIPWRGKLKFRTYKQAKIIKYGLLVRVICETITGYIGNIEIYGGKGRRLKETISSLLEPYLDQWYHVYQDNYYNSIKIAENLLKNKVRNRGSKGESKVRNRGLPSNLKSEELKLKKKWPLEEMVKFSFHGRIFE